MRFRAGARGDYEIRPVDDLTLLHHRPPGTTHVISPASTAILEVLVGEELGIEDIIARLQLRHELEPNSGETIAETIAARLDEMAAMDIIDRLS